MNNQIEVNKNIREHVDYVSKCHPNCIKISTANTKEHEIKKALMSIDLLFEGKTIYTECEHRELDRRSDIYVADDNLVIEIMKSETEKSIEEKRKAFNMFNYKFEEERI